MRPVASSLLSHAPPPRRSWQLLRGRHRPRAGQRHRRPRHGRERRRSPTTARSSSPSPSPRPGARCGPSSRRTSPRVGGLPGVTAVRLEWTEMTAEQRATAMAQARWNIRGEAPPTPDPATAPGHRRGVGQGRRRQVVGHREPGRGPGRPGLRRRRARRRHLGLLRPPHARASRAGSRARPGGRRRSPRASAPRARRRRRAPRGRLHGLPRRRGGRGAHVAGPHAQPGRAALPRGRALGRDLDYLLIDMPPGTGDVQMGLARMLPRAEMLIVTTPALGAQKVAPGRPTWPARATCGWRGHREHERLRATDGGSSPAVRQGGGEALAAEIGAPLLGPIPLEAAVAAGGDAGGRWPSATARRPRPSGPSPSGSSPRRCRRSRWPAARPGSVSAFDAALRSPTRPPGRGAGEGGERGRTRPGRGVHSGAAPRTMPRCCAGSRGRDRPARGGTFRSGPKVAGRPGRGDGWGGEGGKGRGGGVGPSCSSTSITFVGRPFASGRPGPPTVVVGPRPSPGARAARWLGRHPVAEAGRRDPGARRPGPAAGAAARPTMSVRKPGGEQQGPGGEDQQAVERGWWSAPGRRRARAGHPAEHAQALPADQARRRAGLMSTSRAIVFSAPISGAEQDDHAPARRAGSGGRTGPGARTRV